MFYIDDEELIVIAGAGGHALEVFDELIYLNPIQSENRIFCFDENTSISSFKTNIEILHSEQALKNYFPSSFNFCLGVGNPLLRKKMIDFLEKIGGLYLPFKSRSAIISESVFGDFDALSQTFIGPEVKIGLGSLINVGANVHHECKLGDFVEIGPGSLILGNAEVGDFTQIGAGTVILPGIKVGKNCKIGAGSVVTRNIGDGMKAYGVPCKIK